MPRKVSITLGILRALCDQPIALPKLHTTTLSQGRTLLHDLLVSLPIGGQEDVLLLHGGVSHDFLRPLGSLVCIQGYREGKQLCYPFFSQAVSKMDSITSSTGFVLLESGLSGKVLVIGAFLPHSYYALIAEVIEVFAHKKGSHLSNEVAR
jgi:hypothetical protein